MTEDIKTMDFIDRTSNQISNSMIQATLNKIVGYCSTEMVREVLDEVLKADSDAHKEATEKLLMTPMSMSLLSSARTAAIDKLEKVIFKIHYQNKP